MMGGFYAKKLIAFLLLPAFLFACTAGQKRTGVGAVAGAVAGAAIGGATGGKKGATIGAVIGSIGGMFMGYLYHLKQETADLAAQVNQNTGQINAVEQKINESNNTVSLTFKDNALFNTNSAILLPGGERALDGLVDIIKKHGQTKATIKGYTDSIGREEYNLALSRWRAEAVENYLVSHGIDSRRLQSFGYGEANPVASNETAAGRMMNRRVEITLY